MVVLSESIKHTSYSYGFSLVCIFKYCSSNFMSKILTTDITFVGFHSCVYSKMFAPLLTFFVIIGIREGLRHVLNSYGFIRDVFYDVCVNYCVERMLSHM